MWGCAPQTPPGNGLRLSWLPFGRAHRRLPSRQGRGFQRGGAPVAGVWGCAPVSILHICAPSPSKGEGATGGEVASIGIRHPEDTTETLRRQVPSLKRPPHPCAVVGCPEGLRPFGGSLRGAAPHPCAVVGCPEGLRPFGGSLRGAAPQILFPLPRRGRGLSGWGTSTRGRGLEGIALRAIPWQFAQGLAATSPANCRDSRYNPRGPLPGAGRCDTGR